MFTGLGGGQFQWSGIDLLSGAGAVLELTGIVPASLAAGSAFVSLADVTPFPGAVDPNPQSYDTDTDTVAGAASATPLGLAIASFAGDSTTTPSLSALAASDLTYQVTVANTSANAQSDVSVPVTVPSNFALQADTLSASSGTTSIAGGVITWSIPTLAAGASATVTYTETTDSPVALESDATTASATSDQNAAPVTASSSVEVLPVADLSISVTDGTDTIAPGASDTYTVTVTNNGPSAVSGTSVSDSLSGGFVALFAISSIGGTSFSDPGPNQFEWSGIDLASGASATFGIMGVVSTSLTAGITYVDLVNASTSPAEIDTDPSNDAVDADVVIPVPQAITFSGPTTGIVGQSTTLSATGGNSGNPVDFSIDPTSGAGVCAVSGVDGSTLTYDQPGTCVVDANQAGRRELCRGIHRQREHRGGPATRIHRRRPTGEHGRGRRVHLFVRSQRSPVAIVCPGAGRAIMADTRRLDRCTLGHATGGHRHVYLLGAGHQRRRTCDCRTLPGRGDDPTAVAPIRCRHCGRSGVPVLRAGP